MGIMKTRILSLIDGSGKSDSFLEEAIGLPRGIIYKWRNDKNKNFKFYAIDIASYFHVSTDYLLGRTDDPRPVGEGEQPAPITESRPQYPLKYDLLTPANKGIVDRLIEDLVRSQSPE